MSRRILLIALIGGALTMCRMAPPPALAPSRPSASCVSGRCHREIATKRYIHGPIGFGSCEVCHPVSDWPTGKHPVIITETHGDRCLFCHEEAKGFTTMKYKHTLVARGECTACHDPHQSDNGFLLRGPSDKPLARFGDLCGECHDTATLRSASFHAGVALLDCGTCHEPHGSPFPSQLTRYVKTVYLRDHLAIGQDELQAGNHREALENLSLVLTIDPRETSALVGSIEAHLALNDPAAASPLADRILETNPLSAEGFFLKGRIAASAGQLYQAVSFYQRALTLKPEQLEFLIALGALQHKLGMHTDSLATLGRAVQKNASSAPLHSLMADVLEALGRKEEAARERELERRMGAPPKP
jgi:predicted CXXCH cytochrome family protein